MHDNDKSPGFRPLTTTVALLFALAINGAIALAMLRSGVDDRPATRLVQVAAPSPVIAELGELPMITVHACRSAS